MRKRFAIGLAFAIMLGTMPAYAGAYANDSDITFEEYSIAVEKEYAKYGIEGGVYEPEGEFFCTYEMLQHDLAIIDELCQSDVDYQQTASVSETGKEEYVSPTAMRGTVTMTDTYIYSNLAQPTFPRSCTIQTTADIVVDYQGAYIAYAEKPTLEVLGATGYADWIEYVSHSTSINQSKHRVTMDITCKIKEETSVGMVTSWAKKQISYTAVFKNVPC